MGIIAYLIYCFASASLALFAGYLITRIFVAEGETWHGVLVCVALPIIVAALTLALAETAEPTTEQLNQMVRSGQMVDPGPAAFAKWLFVVGGPIVAYSLISVPLFLLARRRFVK